MVLPLLIVKYALSNLLNERNVRVQGQLTMALWPNPGHSLFLSIKFNLNMADTHFLMYCMWLLSKQNSRVECLQQKPQITKPKIFTICTFTEKVCELLYVVKGREHTSQEHNSIYQTWEHSDNQGTNCRLLWG